jgi:uncharacterized protein (TIGR00266 family)
MKYEITGSNLQIANIELKPDEIMNAEAGSMIYKSGNVTISVETKGIGAAVKRMLVGETLFLTKFASVGGTGLIGVAGRIPGKIKAFKLKANEDLIAEKGAYLASESSVNIGVKIVKKIGAGLFGGEGILLQKIKGPGTVLLHAAGDLIEYNLDSGERIDVDTEHIVAFDTSIDYDIRRVGGIKTTIFGGEGLFLAQLTGPGRVVLQSMTKSLFAQKPVARTTRTKTTNSGDVIGGVIRGMTR